MNAPIWTLKHDVRPDDPQMGLAARLLRDGETVAFPTETVYGLGADARSDEAVAKIFEAKGRPSDNPLIVHIADKSQVEELAARLQPMEERLMDRFWPGPLTLVLPLKEQSVSRLVTAGLSTLAIRMPDHPLALTLIRASGCPLAAPSANRSGRPSPTTAAHVAEDLAGRIGGIVDGGPTGVGLESTVIEVRDRVIHLLRPGGVTIEQLREAEPGAEIRIAHGTDEPSAPRSPGMKYAHYAPKGELYVVRSSGTNRMAAWIAEEARARPESAIGVLTIDEHVQDFDSSACEVISLGSLSAPDQIARRLYAALREFDERGIDLIYAESLPETGIGQAVMNRLSKAAGHRRIELD